MPNFTLNLKGVILAGGLGTRLLPLTRNTNKHLLPIYDKQMIFYPLQTLIDAGIKNILITTGPEYVDQFIELLGYGEEFEVSLVYKIQKEPGGIAQALALAEDFVGDDNVCVILGDNIFEDKIDLSNFVGGARIFLKDVDDAKRFGVAEIDREGRVLNIVEKPNEPKTNFAVTGLYVYDSKVFDIIRQLKPSLRGQLEITDVNNVYIKSHRMEIELIKGFWSDAGTFESLFKTSEYLKKKLISK